MSGLGNGAGVAWAGRIAASGWRSETFLVMARVLREALDLMLRARTAPSRGREASGPGVGLEGVAWEDAYRTRPEAVEGLIRTLDPSFSANPPLETAGFLADSPRPDRPLGPWLRESMARIETIVRKIDGLANPETGMVSDGALKGGEFKALVETAKANARLLAVEIRVGADDATALADGGGPAHARPDSGGQNRRRRCAHHRSPGQPSRDQR